MRILGHHWGKSFITLIERSDKVISRIDFLSSIRPSWGFTWRVFIGMVPAILASVISIEIAPLLVFLTLIFLFMASRPVYGVLFELSSSEIFYFIMTPLHLIVSTWVLLLMWFDKIYEISRIAGPVTLALIVVLWPVYSKRAKASRRPLSRNYGIACVFVILQQLAFLTEK